MQRNINLIISDNNHEQRFDQAVAELIPELSRSRIQKWIKSGELTLNNEKATPKQKVYIGDIINGSIEEKEETDHQPQNIDLDIVYDDEHVIVINKPVGLVVHPGAGNHDGTLLNGLLYHFPELQNIPRAGIVHRLDKDTSGVMVVAKTLEAQFHLVQQLQKRTVKRHYVALAVGEFTGGGTVTANIGRSGNDRLRMSVTPGGKEAITHYNILERYTGLTLIECQLETGRTHQIRVHMAHIRHPLVGDSLYGGRNRIPKGLDAEVRDMILNFPRQALHAFELEFIHPHTQEPMQFETELPKDLQELIDQLPEAQHNGQEMDWTPPAMVQCYEIGEDEPLENPFDK
ncbi:MAG: 23S rRNA pseudouridine(1911/1915/1917) synthase RluD [Gammaproteobacteria bacterium]|nr:23S rRNA pseudouridine(1911/1915/1917) synthase RluD [Gammaproteobacteria bacterium]